PFLLSTAPKPLPTAASTENPIPHSQCLRDNVKCPPGASATATPTRIVQHAAVCGIVSRVPSQNHSIVAPATAVPHWTISDVKREPRRGNPWNRNTSDPTPIIPLMKNNGNAMPDKPSPNV